MPLEETKWYVAVGDETRGPMSGEEIRDLHRRGVIEDSTLVWRWDAKQASALPLGILIGAGESALPRDPWECRPDDVVSGLDASRFPMLHWLSSALHILGWVYVALGAVGLVASPISLVISTTGWGQGVGLISFLGSISVAVGGLLLMAFAEAIHVLLAIEENTRRTAENTSPGK